jgi:hypothetical protein
MDIGVNLPRGFQLSTVALHFQTQLVRMNQPKWRVATDVSHVIITTSVAVNRMLKTTGRDCFRVRKGNEEGDVPWGFFL